MIVVCNLVQYSRHNGKINKENGVIVRESVKIPDSIMESYNEEHETTQYVLNKKETEKYNKKETKLVIE